MKIRQIEIINFQSHRHTIIDLDDGMNVIKGDSHNGKSSIVRAIKWMMKNQPSGDGFCSWFADKNEYTEVIFKFDDDTKLIRRRNKDINFYIKPDGESCLAGKGAPPPDILKILDMTDINLLSQDDGHFMLGMSGGERAQTINDMVGLDIIGKVLHSANSIVDRAESKKKANLELIEELDEAVNSAHDLSSIEKSLKKCDKIRTHIAALINKKQQLAIIIGQIQNVDLTIKECDDWLIVTKLRDELQDTLSKYQSYNETAKRLDKLLDDIDYEDKSIKKMNVVLSYKPDIESLNDQLDKIQDMKKRVNSLDGILDEIDRVENTINRNNDVLKQLLQCRQKIDTCPTCHRQIGGWKNGRAKGVQ